MYNFDTAQQNSTLYTTLFSQNLPEFDALEYANNRIWVCGTLANDAFLASFDPTTLAVNESEVFLFGGNNYGLQARFSF